MIRLTDREIIVSLVLALFAGCATKIEHGNFRFVTYGNASHLAVAGSGIRLEATGLNHSLPTGTAFRGASQLVSAAGVAALPFSGVPSVVKAAPIVPATIPAFRVSPSAQ